MRRILKSPLGGDSSAKAIAGPKSSGRLLPIGELARRAGVSIKALRFYQSMGLFMPACIDARTGYRYYQLDQLRELSELRELLALGFSVAETRGFLAQPENCMERVCALAMLRDRLALRLSQDIARVQGVDARIRRELCRAGQPCIDRPMRRSLNAVYAYTLRDRVPSMGPAAYRMFEEAEARVGHRGARSPRSPFLLFHDREYRDRHVDIEVCVPVIAEHRGMREVRRIEGLKAAACMRFSGSYRLGPATYRNIRQWMAAQGLEACGPVRETYLKFGADQRGYELPVHRLARRAEDYLTEVQVPVI